MVKYLVWDFDGVLCDSLKIAYEAHNDICIKYNMKLKTKSIEEYKEIINSKDSPFNCLNRIELEKYFCEHRKKMYKRKDELKIFDNILKIIEEISIPSIIITATYEKLVKYVIKNNYHDTKVFKEIIGRERFQTKKDRLENFNKKYNIRNNEVIYIGDSLSDIQFCNEQGVRIIVVTYGYCPKEILIKQNVEKICDNIDQIKEYIDNIINEN